MPADHELPDRLAGVANTVYVVFTSGYATAGDDLVRIDLCDEAIRLTRLLVDLMPGEPRLLGLLALLLLTDARRATRLDAEGEVVLLADADRTRWDRAKIDEGVALVAEALRRCDGWADPYQLQAAIAACHNTAPSFEATDWAEIVRLYDYLADVAPSPVVLLNRAVAVAERDGPAAGLEALAAVAGLERFHLWHAARGELLARAGQAGEARTALEQALRCEPSAPEQRLLRRR
nr:DUF6596 domain-containing protein [Micromonospora sp. DSM 115978]